MGSWDRPHDVWLLFLILTLATTSPCLSKPLRQEVRHNEHQFITDQVRDVVVDWWPLVADNKLIISTPDLDKFFERYVPGTNPTLVVIEEDFIGGAESWTKDFEHHGMADEYSAAYFRSLDVYLETSLVAPPRLTIQDLDDMIILCETYADGGNGIGQNIDGYINREEFTAGFEEVILRGASFSLLFVRFNNHSSPQQRYENLDNEEFFNIFYAMDAEGNDRVSDQEFSSFWQQGQYGPQFMAETLFSKLDFQDSGDLDENEWQELFVHLDCREPEGGLDTEEFYQLDLLLHNLTTYPSDDCILTRLPETKH